MELNEHERTWKVDQTISLTKVKFQIFQNFGDNPNIVPLPIDPYN